MGKSIGLAAPTGRAAQRLSKMTGLEAKTLHRLLEFSPASLKFQRNLDNPLPFDAIVVDETSMLDLFLAHSLLKAVSLGCQLLLVGDVDQLPSVGPGQVLSDLIDSKRVSVVRLTQVFRQAQTSAIVQAAHLINQGQFPQLDRIHLDSAPRSDCLWYAEAEEPEAGVNEVCQLLSDYIPQQGFNPAQAVQVLCPITRGPVGTRHFNQVLQQLLNPPDPLKPEMSRAGMIFRVGDKVIQLKNDYTREVFNGDLGIISRINQIDKEVTIDFDGRDVVIDYADLNEITLAWSITIHKSQGSEYPVVLLPIYMTHYPMLSRNLIYTGLTRAKQLAILIGSHQAIHLAVEQTAPQQRYTRLSERLQAKVIDTTN